MNAITKTKNWNAAQSALQDLKDDLLESNCINKESSYYQKLEELRSLAEDYAFAENEIANDNS